jgi:hypothetical protein
MYKSRKIKNVKIKSLKNKNNERAIKIDTGSIQEIKIFRYFVNLKTEKIIVGSTKSRKSKRLIQKKK